MANVLLPEWNSCKSILLAWPFPGSDWSDSESKMQAVDACYWQMLTQFTQYCAASNPEFVVTVLLHPNMDQSAWLNNLTALGIPDTSVNVISHLYYNDTWIRDYGPLSCSSGYKSFVFNGWGGKYSAECDNNVAGELCRHMGVGIELNEFVLEGGALEINSRRQLLANKECVINDNRNSGYSCAQVEHILQSELGVEEILWIEDIQLTGDDTDGHIDTVARFVDDETIVYSGFNAQHSDVAVLRSLEEQVTRIAEEQNFKTCSLPTPQIHSQEDGRPLPATYANFLITNGFLFLPVYGVEEDSLAIDILNKCCGDKYTIVPIRCEALLEQHGSLHCATMQMA
ncbi:agmatine deiminase family protein [Teredinibacter sp. KSP-S5-2]|uniref:agmatine deiminase family protein n=1 Tax=Teredinibacter sp. KSP-S5-2 TaxID=3034506 RepID=UPI0029341B05|nr:agmatine deiminase family protein [Teredinibacter sp. KSP-S5-2]WNO07701.1 agmatine deiminase family protein [Teredinibacter sp. KSP-S5-2]